MIPLGDSPNPVKTPWMTWLLIAANCLVFVGITLPQSGRRLTSEDLRDPAIRQTVEQMAQVFELDRESPRLQDEWLNQLSHYDLYVFRHGYQPGAADLRDLLWCMFLHGNLMHLLGNMLFLWIYGDNVEARLGPFFYLLSYLLTGVAATWTFSVMAGGSMLPLVGASGAISGVLGFYLIWYPRHRVKLLIWFGFLFSQIVYLPASVVLIMYLVLSNLLPLLGNVQTGTAYGAHIGGFVTGAVLGWILKDRLALPEWKPEPRMRRRGYGDSPFGY